MKIVLYVIASINLILSIISFTFLIIQYDEVFDIVIFNSLELLFFASLFLIFYKLGKKAK